MKRTYLCAAILCSIVVAGMQAGLEAQEGATPRVANKTEGNANGHVLDPAIEMAKKALANSQANIRDYSCTLVKRERIDGELKPYDYIYTKIRNRKVENGKTVQPFSVYMYFLRPADAKGREVIYVEGRDEGKMCAHEGGRVGNIVPNLWLDPKGFVAMKGQRYPLTEVGLENLMVQLITRAERDRKRGECKVQFRRNAQVNGRKCTVIQVVHPTRRDYFDFHVAQIFVDDQLQVPIRYAAYDWPTAEGERPALIEEYTYLNLKVNVGLSNGDFDVSNKNYNFE
jgi:hypothetical protein